MKYLIDTCVISDFIQGETATLAKLTQIEPSQISISSISVMEVYYGLQRNPARAKKIEPVIDELFCCVSILAFTTEDAKEAGVIRAYLRKKGEPIGAYDILIAGTAINNGLVLVTANHKEFNRVPNLICESWR